MTRLALALVSASVFAVLSACGGGGEPPVRLLLEADLSELPEGADPEEVMKDAVEILERRATAYGMADVSVELDGLDRLAVTLPGVSADEARDLIGRTAHLEFRQPILNENGEIVCQAEDGSEFSVEPQQFTGKPTEGFVDGGNCAGASGQLGDVLWEPATATDSEGVERVLTGAFLRPNAEVIGPPTAVAIEFTGEGGLLFEQITEELVGLPLAIFLDDDLVSAPTVQQPITGGSANITGLDLEEARILAIQLNAGALPAPIEVVSVEETR